MVQVGEAGVALTKAAMETWMLNFNNNAAEKHDLLAADVRLTHMSQVTDAPETRDGKAEVIDFFRDFENATGAREFLSVDGGAFMIENKGNNLHPRMGLLIFEVNPEGKIQDIKIWVASLQGDRDDLSDSGLTSVAPSLLDSRGEGASVSGALASRLLYFFFFFPRVLRVEAWRCLACSCGQTCCRLAFRVRSSRRD